MAARTEALSLYRSFVRLRHMFPNRESRSIMRRWVGFHFRARAVEYEQIVRKRGIILADLEAETWRDDAREDVEMLRQVGSTPEPIRRDITTRIKQHGN